VTEPGEVVRVATRGDGVTFDGRYVPLTAPGDFVDPDGGITRGSHHQNPPCRHFPICGGCTLQHLDDASYGRFIVDRITGALGEQGIALPTIDPPRLSPPRTRRRISLRAEKRGRAVTIGFNEAGTHRIVDMRECHIMLPELFALVAPLRMLLGAIAPAGVRMTITATRVDQGVDLLIAGLRVDSYEAHQALSDFATAQSLARLSVDEGDGPTVRHAPHTPTITLGGVPVALPEGAFLQATAEGEAALVDSVARSLASAGRVVDLFAGLGTFAIPLDRPVLAVEGIRDVALALGSAARSARKPVEVEHRDLFRRPLAASELARFDAAVLDPPRAGAAAQMAELAKSSIAGIAYVSCNPATFARDAAVLIAAGYRLERITPVGQFRWSTHVELCASFRR